VAVIHAQDGDVWEAGLPVVVLAEPGEPVVRVALGERQVDRIAVGQPATVRAEGSDGATLNASVEEITGAESDLGAVATIRVRWPEAAPPAGTAVQVTITLQQKDQALLVPRAAVRSLGSRWYVEYLDGASRRIAMVDVGTLSVDDAEILRGLSEGQIVFLGP
jgi:multidrug resistance efflux pump